MTAEARRGQEAAGASADRTGHRAAVIGSPVAHSLSPVLHRAAYADLGLSTEQIWEVVRIAATLQGVAQAVAVVETLD